MTSIIRWLHGGGRYPREIFASSQEYRNLARLLEYEKDAFVNDLTPGQMKQFEKLLDADAAVERYEHSDAFRVGFCIGARIMMEVIQFEER